MPPSSSAPSLDSLESSDSNALLRLIIDSSAGMMAYFAADSLCCRFANQAYAQHYGRRPEEILGKQPWEIMGEENWQAIAQHIERCLRGENVRYVRHARSPLGELREIEVRITPHLEQGTLRGAVVQVQDLSLGRSVQQQLDESEERMRLFSAATHEAIMLHRDGLVLDANAALLRLVGYSLEEVRGQPVLQHLDREYWPLALEAMQSGRNVSYKATVRHKDGRSIPVEVDALVMPAGKGAQDYRLVVLRDITAHQQAEAQVRFLAEHDALTRLSNRWHLSDQLEPLLLHARAQKQALAVLSIDLRHFSAINDSLGHQAGDQVLCEMALRLRSCAQAGDLLARAGSDEFIAVLAGNTGRAQAELRTREMAALLEMPCQVTAQRLVVAPAIGIAVFPEDGETIEALLRNAGAARQLAKESSHQPFQFYTPALESRASRMLNQEQLLRQSIALGGFELHYQPQVCLDSGAFAGVEALVRWRHPQRGLVSPEEFVALAEARGLITAIDRWVLRQACQEACAWRAQGMRDVPVAVNMSAQEFRHPDLAGEVATVLAESGLPAQLLHIELTESTLMHSDAQVLRTLHALQELGVQLAIDDFGTGYSSLAYLRRRPIHQLKIDRSFITDLTENDDDAAIVTAIVQMARSLRLRTVAEGVETGEQLALLRTLGCEMAQGYHIAPPMPAAQLLQWQKDYDHRLSTA